MLAAGNLEAARTLVESAGRESGAAEIGRATIALFENDAGAAIDHAQRAIELGAGVTGHQYLALGHLCAQDAAAAITHARKAVELEPSARARSTLASVLLASGDPGEAATLLRQVLAEQPDDADALLNLGTASVELEEYGEAIVCYSQAFDRRPTDPRPVQQLLEMFAAVGKWLGAAAALDLLRPGEPPPEVEVALALVRVRLIQLIANGFPEREVDDDTDDTIAKLVASALERGPQTQLAVAHTLLEVERELDARTLVAAASEHSARTPLDVSAAGDLRCLQAHLAARDGNPTRALALYAQSLTSNRRRIEACTNAIALLLEDGTATGLAQIPQWLNRVAAADRKRDPTLVFYEAVYLMRSDRTAQARLQLQQVLELTGGNGSIAEDASRLLDQLSAPSDISRNA
jgi:tetratricopeptide (TPR) repeat protein